MNATMDTADTTADTDACTRDLIRAHFEGRTRQLFLDVMDRANPGDRLTMVRVGRVALMDAHRLIGRSDELSPSEELDRMCALGDNSGTATLYYALLGGLFWYQVRAELRCEVNPRRDPRDIMPDISLYEHMLIELIIISYASTDSTPTDNVDDLCGYDLVSVYHAARRAGPGAIELFFSDPTDPDC